MLTCASPWSVLQHYADTRKQTPFSVLFFFFFFFQRREEEIQRRLENGNRTTFESARVRKGYSKASLSSKLPGRLSSLFFFFFFLLLLAIMLICRVGRQECARRAWVQQGTLVARIHFRASLEERWPMRRRRQN